MRSIAGPALASLTIPAWFVGLDQGVWLLAAAAVAWNARSRTLPRWFLAGAVALVGVVAVAGLLFAPQSRWLALAREVLIAAAFVSVAAAVASRPLRESRGLLLALSAVVVTSSALSIVVFVTQQTFAFQTPIASLIPADIAATGLGRLTFIDRALGEQSYFLGHLFIRPRGLFLFSTSQAVAQAAWIPALVVLARQRPGKRGWWIAAAAVTVVALLVSTTRVPLVAICAALIITGLAVAMGIGHLRLTIPFTPPWVAGYAALVLAAIVGASWLGLGGPIERLVATRSLEERAGLYQWTFQVWQERPWLGWGSEVDPFPTPTPRPTPLPTANPLPTESPRPAPSPAASLVPPANRPPLGSHSQYLGVLFKDGIVGLGLFMVVASIVLAAAVRTLRRRTGSALFVAAFLATLGAGLTESLWLDPATAIYVGVVWGAVLSAAAWDRPPQPG